MVKYTIGSAFKNAEEQSVYGYLVQKNGKPEDYAKKLKQDPAAMLADFEDCLKTYSGLKIAAISDTDGSYAIPMACMGADMTVFGIFEDGKRYSEKTAEAAGVHINYEICNILETDERFWDSFDAVVISKATIHYFYDIEAFFGNIRSMIKRGGRLICADFHPFYKNGIYCTSKGRFGLVQQKLPEAAEKRFALTEILQEVSLCGLKITEFEEKTVTNDFAERTLAYLTAEKV